MTTAEIKDAAIFVMAYSFLKMDSTQELGLFINKKASKFIDELIEQLPPSRKRIFILSRKKYLSTKQIAKIMQISVSTVETQLWLAVKFIRKHFEKNFHRLFLLGLILLI